MSESDITTITVQIKTRDLLGTLISGNETVGEGLHRVLTEYKKLKHN